MDSYAVGLGWADGDAARMTDAEIRAERILDDMQRSRDFQLLREMNGRASGNRATTYLQMLNRPGYGIQNERTKREKKQLAS